MQDWEKSELEEQISQATLLIKKLLVTPEDCQLRDRCEAWVYEHRSYLQDDEEEAEPIGYDVSKVDEPEEPKGYILTEFVDEKDLNF